MPVTQIKKRIQAKKRTRRHKKARYVIVLFLDDHHQIDFALVARIERQMREQITSDPKHTELELWLVGPGGFATAAFLLWRLLRAFGRFVRVAVPSQAWSAATLIALGCDEIVMASYACLGPLDQQIQHPDREEEVCGVDIVKSSEIYGQQAAKFLRKIADAVPGAGELTAEQGIRLTMNLCQRALEKADPLLGAKVQRAVKLPIRYLTEMFAERACPTPEGFDGEKVAKHFVYEFDTHIDAIHRDHLRALGLPVADLESYEYRAELWEAYGNWLDRKNAAEPFIEVRRLDS